MRYSWRGGSVEALGQELRRHLREVGVAGTITRAARRLVAETRKLAFSQPVDAFDSTYGTDTKGVIRPSALDIPQSQIVHAGRYQTAIDSVFIDIVQSLLIPFDRFVFVDLGSGKGRALLLASRWPFKSIVGVELSESLHQTACQNIQIYASQQRQLCSDVVSRREDAASFTIPDDNLVFYLFNPFDEHVMTAVLRNIEASFLRHPRQMYIAYLKPVYRHLFDRADFLTVAKETERYVVYRSREYQSH